MTMFDEHNILQDLADEQLPPTLQAVSQPFLDLARAIVGDGRGMPAGTSIQFPLPEGDDRALALKGLLEARDAAVRARSSKPVPSPPWTEGAAGVTEDPVEPEPTP
jgi:hypothetical protein